jgi:hypothetical protein
MCCEEKIIKSEACICHGVKATGRNMRRNSRRQRALRLRFASWHPSYDTLKLEEAHTNESRHEHCRVKMKREEVTKRPVDYFKGREGHPLI